MTCRTRTEPGTLAGTKFDGSSMLVCPACNKAVHVGFGGEKNLAIHQTLKACQKASQKRTQNPSKTGSKSNQTLHTFFKPHVPLNPPMVTAPPPIHADEKVDFEADKDGTGALHEFLGDSGEPLCEAISPSTDHLTERGPCKDLGSTIRGTKTGIETFLEGTKATEMHNGVEAPRHSLQARKSPCPRGIKLLNRLNTATRRIPTDVPFATPAHRLSSFSANPCTCIADPEEDIEDGDWPVLNTMLKTTFGWGELEMKENTKSMLNRGEHGLDGFIQFFKYFVLERGLEGVMIETKVDVLLCELNKR